jgi:hypothetical protein
MRVLSFLFFGCLLMPGCASPSPPKPSPYHYGVVTTDAPRRDRMRVNPYRTPASTKSPTHGR